MRSNRSRVFSPRLLHDVEQEVRSRLLQDLVDIRDRCATQRPGQFVDRLVEVATDLRRLAQVEMDVDVAVLAQRLCRMRLAVAVGNPD